jgi:hypothetical protein
MSGAISPLPQYDFMVWCLVKKHRDNFTFFTTEIVLLCGFYFKRPEYTENRIKVINH